MVSPIRLVDMLDLMLPCALSTFHCVLHDPSPFLHLAFRLAAGAALLNFPSPRPVLIRLCTWTRWRHCQVPNVEGLPRRRHLLPRRPALPWTPSLVFRRRLRGVLPLARAARLWCSALPEWLFPASRWRPRHHVPSRTRGAPSAHRRHVGGAISAVPASEPRTPTRKMSALRLPPIPRPRRPSLLRRRPRPCRQSS